MAADSCAFQVEVRSLSSELLATVYLDGAAQVATLRSELIDAGVHAKAVNFLVGDRIYYDDEDALFDGPAGSVIVAYMSAKESFLDKTTLRSALESWQQDGKVVGPTKITLAAKRP